MIFLLVKLLAISVLGVTFLVPAVILLLIFLAELALRVVTKVFGYKKPAPSFFGPFLDSDMRRAFQKPELIIRRSGMQPGMRVLEIGCGSGAYTTFVARHIGALGSEYALDVQPAMLRQLENKLSRKENSDLRNVTLVESSAAQLPFHNEFFDLVFMVSTLQQIPEQRQALEEVWRVLKPGGIFAVTEIIMDPYYSFRRTTRRLVTAAGFAHDATLGTAGHYTIRFKKAGGR